jgi:hypothetical protein
LRQGLAELLRLHSFLYDFDVQFFVYLCDALDYKNTLNKKQGLDVWLKEHLLCKWEALSSNPTPVLPKIATCS